MFGIEPVVTETGESSAESLPPAAATRAESLSRPSARGARRPRLHLVLGDSTAQRADITSRFRGDRVLNLARDTERWASLLDHLEADITTWQAVAAAKELKVGTVILWLTGDDVYGGNSGIARFDMELLESVSRAATDVITGLWKQAEAVLLFGPLARLASEVPGVTWESTGAYHLERNLSKLDLGVQLICLGRALTRKMGRHRHGLKGCDQWYLTDGVHLSPEGYAKLAEHGSFPVWLTLRSAN